MQKFAFHNILCMAVKSIFSLIFLIIVIVQTEIHVKAGLYKNKLITGKNRYGPNSKSVTVSCVSVT